MRYLFLIELFGFIGLVWFMGRMHRRGVLTEQFFALSSLTYISLFLLTAFLLAPLTFDILLIWVIITAVLWVIGYPFARWIYRQAIPPR